MNQFLEKICCSVHNTRSFFRLRGLVLSLTLLLGVSGFVEAQPCPAAAALGAHCCTPADYGLTAPTNASIHNLTSCGATRTFSVAAGGTYQFSLNPTTAYTFSICYPSGSATVPQMDLWSDLAGTALLATSTTVTSGSQTCTRIIYTPATASACDVDVFLSVFRHSCVRDWTPFTLTVSCSSCALSCPQDTYWSSNGPDCDADNRSLPVPTYCNPTLPIVWDYTIVDATGAIVTSGTYTGGATPPIISDLVIGHYQVTFSATAALNPSICPTTFPLNCAYNLVVLPVMACDDLINVSLAAGCSATITPQMLLEDYCVDVTPLVETNDIEYVVNVNNTGSNVVTNANVGQQLSTTISVYIDANGNNLRDAGEPILNSCWGYIKVEDKYGPIIDCGKNTVLCGAPTSVEALGSPSVNDECSSVASLTHLDYETNYTSCADNDNDGILNDDASVDPTTGVVTIADAGDLDGDGIPDDLDPDTDGDGILDANDVDDDNDGIGDGLDPDDDNDGVDDNLDMDDSNCDGIDDDCDGYAWTKLISRTWTATDVYNNANSCTQEIFVARPLISPLDLFGAPAPAQFKPQVYIEFPLSLDDVELPSLDCSAAISYDANGHPIVTTAMSGVPSLVVVRDEGDGNPANDTTRVAITSSCLLGYTYTDQFIPICQASWKVIRLWTVLDWCNSNNQQVYSNVNDLQIIKILDKTAPTFTCPTPAQVQISYVNSLTCAGRVILPQVTATDNCSSTFTYSISAPGLGTIHTNGGIFNNVPIGTHVFTYAVGDNCGNIRTCEVTVVLTDVVEPTAVCEQTRVVAIPTSGNAVVFANAFDDGSYDNCGVVSYQVRRLTPGCDLPYGPSAPFADHVEFCCADVNTAGTPIMVELRICDAAGNCNSCMVNVVVQDKISPTISCPANTTTACGPDYEAYTEAQLNTAFGVATGHDNCNVTTSVVTNFSINECGAGTIVRTWTATDPGGRTATCSQTITIVNSDLFSSSDIVWPTDVTRGCGDNLTPAATGNPTLLQDGPCDQVAYGYEDLRLTIVENYCLKILRTWTVLDWCQFNPETGAGRWTHVQTIRVEDNVAPEISGAPTGTVTVSVDANCQVEYVIPAVTATDACDILINPSNPATTISVSIVGTGTTSYGPFTNDYTHTLVRGTYRVCYTADDRCGNRTTNCYDLVVSDLKKPTPVCINGLATSLMNVNGGMVEVWASDFESGSSYDNCSDHEDLTYFINRIPQGGAPSQTVPTTTSVSFTCDDLGTQFIQLWVCDEAGNCDFCQTYILIQNNMNIPNCGDPEGNAAVSGNITTELNDEIDNVTVTVTGNVAIPVVTGSNGYYGVPDLQMDATYTVSPEKNIEPLNGVTTYDLVLISKHILGIQQLDSPYKLIAADVNKSKTITTIDLVQLRQLILHMVEQFPSNNSWRFVDKSYQFQNPTNAQAETFPEIYNISSLNADMLIDFIGVKVGDVNGSATANSLLGSEDRNANGALNFKVENQQLSAGNDYTVNFRANDFKDILGYQFTMNFNNEVVEFVSLKEGELAGLSNDNFGLGMVNEGIITSSWNSNDYVNMKDDAVLFSVTFRAKQNATLSDVVSIGSRYTAAEAYSKRSDNMQVGIQFGNAATATTEEFALYQNQPNPFKGETAIRFYLPEATSATLTIYDIAGKVLKVIDSDYAKGTHEVKVSKAELQANGVVYYRLQTPKYNATKKMLIVE
ncbi:MAG: T9SS type A sorting domain-containing protein [Saprospiraceae bacterium]|nr:T9SS type A sorting domain-containing protein [Saprospiraceae bacterium]MBP7679810.1 T9SS type A sorting domain-containing protein [Saprospiraceae bacterium]